MLLYVALAAFAFFALARLGRPLAPPTQRRANSPWNI